MLKLVLELHLEYRKQIFRINNFDTICPIFVKQLKIPKTVKGLKKQTNHISGSDGTYRVSHETRQLVNSLNVLPKRIIKISR